MAFQTTKTTSFPALTLALAATLTAAFAMTGCSKNKNDNTQVESPTWEPPPLPELINYDRHALFFQVSVEPVVYIWQQLPCPEDIPKDRIENSIVVSFPVMPSRLEDAMSRMKSYKITAEADGKAPTIWLTGDDRAICGPILRLIDDAKRAGIEQIFFETYYRETGIGNYSDERWAWEGMSVCLYHYDFKSDAKYARKIVTVTISADDTMAWEKKPVSLEGLVEKLRDYRDKVGPENTAMVVEVDDKSSYPPLRFVLDQLKRADISKVMVCPRKAE